MGVYLNHGRQRHHSAAKQWFVLFVPHLPQFSEIPRRLKLLLGVIVLWAMLNSLQCCFQQCMFLGWLESRLWTLHYTLYIWDLKENRVWAYQNYISYSQHKKTQNTKLEPCTSPCTVGSSYLVCAQGSSLFSLILTQSRSTRLTLLENKGHDSTSSFSPSLVTTCFVTIPF